MMAIIAYLCVIFLLRQMCFAVHVSHPNTIAIARAAKVISNSKSKSINPTPYGAVSSFMLGSSSGQIGVREKLR